MPWGENPLYAEREWQVWGGLQTIAAFFKEIVGLVCGFSRTYLPYRRRFIDEWGLSKELCRIPKRGHKTYALPKKFMGLQDFVWVNLASLLGY